MKRKEYRDGKHDQHAPSRTARSFQSDFDAVRFPPNANAQSLISFTVKKKKYAGTGMYARWFAISKAFAIEKEYFMRVADA